MNGSPAGARRRPPWGLLAAAAAGIVLEVFVFSRAYLLADQTNLCLLYKKSLLRESRASDDVVIFGDSMPMLLDAAQMERWAGKRYTIRNEAVPELGPSLAYWLELEQYLDYHERPRLILFSTWPHAFYRRGEEVLSRMPDDFFIHRMRRYLDMRYLLREAAFEENAFLRAKNSLEILRVYSENLLPSVNYRIFIRACAPEAIAGTPVEQAADPGVQRHADPRETLRISRELMDRIRETKGQAGFGKNIVSRPDLFRYLPGLEARNPGVVFPGTRSMERFIALAEERGIPTVYFLPPVNPGIRDRIRRLRYLANLEARLAEFEKKYPHFTYFKVEDLGWDGPFFSDPMHLNDWAAERFSVVAIDALDELIRRKMNGEVVHGLPAKKNWQ